MVTPVTGHDEYVAHGENGLVVDWDDPRGTTRALDLLAADRALLHRLRAARWRRRGLAVVGAAGRVDGGGAAALAAEPPPAPAGGGRLSRDLQMNLAIGQRMTLDHTITSTVLKEVREQNAYKVGLWLRGAFLKLTAPVRRVRWWLAGRRR